MTIVMCFRAVEGSHHQEKEKAVNWLFHEGGEGRFGDWPSPAAS